MGLFDKVSEMENDRKKPKANAVHGSNKIPIEANPNKNFSTFSLSLSLNRNTVAAPSVVPKNGNKIPINIFNSILTP